MGRQGFHAFTMHPGDRKKRGDGQESDNDRRGEGHAEGVLCDALPDGTIWAVSFSEEDRKCAGVETSTKYRVLTVPHTRVHELPPWNWKAPRDQALAA